LYYTIVSWKSTNFKIDCKEELYLLKIIIAIQYKNPPKEIFDMDIIETITKRKSIRHYTSDKPSKEVIMQCLEAASWAPNPTSQQPWKFIVLTGAKLKKTIRAIEENYAQAYQLKEQNPEPPMSEQTARIINDRKEKTFQQMISLLIEKGMDMDEVGKGNFTFHNAPVGVIFATYPCKDQNFFKSTVAAMQNFLLAATSKGLGTCWMNAVSICQEHIKKVLNLSAELILVDGVAVGYADDNSPINQLPRERLPVSQVTEWL
jgi:nitroreductase